MCRASRCQLQHPAKMAPQKNNCNSYADRLDHLKRVLKPYRDNNANCLRLMTRSARTNLNKHWKSLENLFTAGHDHPHQRCSKERAQNAANERAENGENTGPSAAVDPTSDAVDGLRRLHVDR